MADASAIVANVGMCVVTLMAMMVHGIFLVLVITVVKRVYKQLVLLLGVMMASLVDAGVLVDVNRYGQRSLYQCP